MFKKLGVLIIQGLLALLPISLTVYLIFWLVSSIEALVVPYIYEGFYFPGLGILVTIATLMIVGLLVNAYFLKWFIESANRVLERIPLIKTLYGAIQDAVNLIQIGKKQKMKSVVSVEISGSIHLIGFITNDHNAKVLFNNQEKVGVYVPMSYQIGGYTLYIDREKLTPLDIDVETAMRMALTGGASSRKDNVKNNS